MLLLIGHIAQCMRARIHVYNNLGLIKVLVSWTGMDGSLNQKKKKKT